MSAAAPQPKADIQSIIDEIISGNDGATRQTALQTLTGLADKDKTAAEAHLFANLTRYQNWQRTWALTALARLNLATSRQAVIDHIAEANEPNLWARHFAILNAATFDPFPEQAIIGATKDPEPLVKATAFRALVALDKDQFADELLKMLDEHSDAAAKWGACRALRMRPEMRRLRKSLEAQFVDPLIDIVANRFLWADTRWEAVQALQGVTHHQPDAAHALSEIVIKHRESNEALHRRTCLDALRILAQPDISQEALLCALHDEDAEIRFRAACLLKDFLGDARAVQLIIARALTETAQDTRQLVDALRSISTDRAAEILSQSLLSPEQKVAESAERMLQILGGEAAARMLQAQRTLVLNRNTELLSKAEGEVKEQLGNLIRQAELGFRVSMIMHGTIFVIGIGVLLASAVLVFRQGADAVQRWIGAAGGAGSLGILLALFYRNPLQNISASVFGLMRVDVIFRGYIRQLNQIDATFKHMFLGGNSFGTAQMKETVEQIQSTVKTTLELVNDDESASAAPNGHPTPSNGKPAGG